MTVADQRLSKLTSQSAFGEFHPAWSPDGKWLTFVTWTAATGGAVWKIPADNSRAAEQITTDNAYYRDPVWSNDGKTIYAITAPKNVRLENAYSSLHGQSNSSLLPSMEVATEQLDQLSAPLECILQMIRSVTLRTLKTRPELLEARWQ